MTKGEGTKQGGKNGRGVEFLELSEDELALLAKVEEGFLGKGTTAAVPELAIFMGHIGAGKTTLRRKVCGEGFVQVDYGDVLVALARALGKRGHPRGLKYARTVSESVLHRAIAEKKNIAMEVTGFGAEFLPPVIQKMKEVGYSVSGRYVEVDLAEGYRRHAKAVEEDEEYLSAYHTEGVTLGLFYRYFGLDTERLDSSEAAKEGRDAAPSQG